jgi:hypothetical protein
VLHQRARSCLFLESVERQVGGFSLRILSAGFGTAGIAHAPAMRQFATGTAGFNRT